jgi:hypothetical protein
MLRTMAEPNVLAELERWLTELARKYERYFARDPKVPVPPERERTTLERRLKELSRGEPRNAAEQFKLDALLHRFATFNQLWQRLLREREERGAAAARVEAQTPRPAAATPPNARAAAPVGDSEGEYRRVFATYRDALDRAGRPSSIVFERFRATLEQQRRAAEERGAVVEGFDVVEDASGVKLRARVRRGKQG